MAPLNHAHAKTADGTSPLVETGPVCYKGGYDYSISQVLTSPLKNDM